MRELVSAFAGFCCAILLMLVVTNDIDDKRVQRGWMEQRGKIYVLTPAKPVIAP